jgi:hypothetical protein
MAAQTPPGPTPQPPPDVPQLPRESNELVNYLRRFSLWCRHGFAAKLNANSALPGLLLEANDAPAGTTPAVFLLQVKTDGTIVATAQVIGKGRP